MAKVAGEVDTMIRSWVRRLRQQFFLWVAREFRSLPISHNAVLGQGTVISSEGTIENIRGIPNSVTVGQDCYIRGRLLTYAHGGKVHIGDWCYVGVRSEIWSMESVTIGNRVLISHDVNINDGSGHSANAAERHEHFKCIKTQGHPTTLAELPGVKSAPIIIEDDVWISFGVIILPGVRIGARSIIAAGAIVTQDVPPDTLYRSQVTPILTPLES
jgi:maltose O-acetyltransferase